MTSETFDDAAAQALPGLLRYAAALTGDREQAQDLVQEVLARAFQHWARVQRSDNTQAYLNRMLTNEFLSWRRRVSRRVVTVPSHLPNSAASGDFVVDMVTESTYGLGSQCCRVVRASRSSCGTTWVFPTASRR